VVRPFAVVHQHRWRGAVFSVVVMVHCESPVAVPVYRQHVTFDCLWPGY
jgi:hypothetical protein